MLRSAQTQQVAQVLLLLAQVLHAGLGLFTCWFHSCLLGDASWKQVLCPRAELVKVCSSPLIPSPSFFWSPRRTKWNGVSEPKPTLSTHRLIHVPAAEAMLGSVKEQGCETTDVPAQLRCCSTALFCSIAWCALFQEGEVVRMGDES